jgi:hypothetical protein
VPKKISWARSFIAAGEAISFRRASQHKGLTGTSKARRHLPSRFRTDPSQWPCWTPMHFKMRNLTIIIDFSSRDLDVASGQEVVDLVSSLEEASVGASSSSSDASSYLPRWNCLPDGTWLRADEECYDECDGTNEQSTSTDIWYQNLISRRPRER